MSGTIFVSSVQREFVAERRAIRDFVHSDPLLRRFFSVVLFEDLPASDCRADDVYLAQVDRCTVFVALLGTDYGSEDTSGCSPTEREFDRASEQGKFRLVYLKGSDDAARHPKMRALVERAGSGLVRRRFGSVAELTGGLYAALVQYLEDVELIRTGPFDAAPCPEALLTDLDADRMSTFLARARQARAFPLPDAATSEELLLHLNLLHHGRPTNAAVLLFGKHPQRFLISSEVKCAHFHGTAVAKPIPSHQVYKGTVFDLVDQSVDFVMSKINLAVGTRARSNEVPVAYEIPPEAVREAIVNAVAHRDYTSNASVQVMLFADRLEVWNPGDLPPSLTIESLRRPHGSVPRNPLLAEPLYLAKYIERLGTGTGDMIARCREAGLPEPLFALTDGFVVTLGRRPQRALEAVAAQGAADGGTKPALSRHQVEIIRKCVTEQPITALMAVARRTDRTKFRTQVLTPLLAEGLLAMTIPGKPRSSNQKYRLTEKGRALLGTLPTTGGS